MEKLLTLNYEGKEIKILQRKDMFCISLDTILITNFIEIKNKTKNIIDFGTNNGAIPLLLTTKFPINIIGIEIIKSAAELAIANVKINNLTKQITIINQDIKIYIKEITTKFDLIICNPPFFNVEKQKKIKLEPLKVPARHEIYITLEEIIASAAKIIENKGRLVMIYPTERMAELFILLEKYNFTPKILQMVYPKINKNANVFLIEAVFQTKKGIIVLPPLICHNEDNSYISEIAKWYNLNIK